MRAERSRKRAAKGGKASAHEGARLSAELALERGGTDVAILDLRQFEVGCDFFVIASGTSEVHVRALADWIRDEVAARLDQRPWHVEGRTHARWVLIDYVDWVVHVFHRETREYYLLEHLWGDAPIERLGEPSAVEDDEGE